MKYKYLPPPDSWINIHSHHKLRVKGEFMLRNAYAVLHSEQLRTLPYPVSIGLHPWFLKKMSMDQCLQYLSEMAGHPSVMAIGETGIDRAVSLPTDLQKAYFELHLAIAEQHQKPLIIHAVKSFYDFIPYLKRSSALFIFHQFNGNLIEAGELIKHGAYLSFGAGLFKPKEMDVFSHMPKANLFLETDTASHLHIADIYFKASEIRGISVEEMKHQVFNNLKMVLRA